MHGYGGENLPMPPSGHAGHDEGDMMQMMPMFFTVSWRTTLWFESWTTRNSSTYAISVVALFCICILNEAITTFRVLYQAKRVGKAAIQAATLEASLLTGYNQLRARAYSIQTRFIVSVMYAITLFFSYMLMLAVMTYNVGYFVAVILGLTTGHFIFFRNTPGVSDVCHAQTVDVDEEV